MKRLIIALILLSPAARADLFFDPHASVGYNVAQGTNFRLGVDAGLRLENNLSAGLGAYYGAGEHPSHDREIGVGPFVSFIQPITSFLMVSFREEINYVDQRNPIETITPQGSSYSHSSENGVLSATSAAVHISFTPNFTLSGGYRFVLALTNDKLDDDRSGAFLGFAFGI